LSKDGAPWSCQVGEGALLLRFGTEIDVEVNKKVLAYMAILDNTPMLNGVTEILPSYASLLLHYDPLKVSSSEVEAWCSSSAAAFESVQVSVSEPREISIPVNYGGEHGPDIDEVARKIGVSAEEVLRMHSEGDYRVYFLGFMGGFPYLGGLEGTPLANIPRLPTPRQQVPGGTVGIAAGQTGVYTVSTPGGWHLLGRTPVSLFDPTMDPPAMLRAGDKIKFVPTTEAIPEQDVLDTTFGSSSSHVISNPWVEVLSPSSMHFTCTCTLTCTLGGGTLPWSYDHRARHWQDWIRKACRSSIQCSA